MRCLNSDSKYVVLLQFHAAKPGDIGPSPELLQGQESRLHHIHRIAGTTALRHHVFNSDRLGDGPKTFPADDSRSGVGRHQHHFRRAKLTEHLMRDRISLHRDFDHPAVGLLDGFFHSQGNFHPFAISVTDAALPISHHDESRETEPTPPFDHTRATANLDHVLGRFVTGLIIRRHNSLRFEAVQLSLQPRDQKPLRLYFLANLRFGNHLERIGKTPDADCLEIQTFTSGGIGQSLHPTVIPIRTPVECNRFNSLFQRTLSDKLADRCRGIDRAAVLSTGPQ